ncbi:MAG: radical SAM protein [Candidatus Nealsonbacteria bacterium]
MNRLRTCLFSTPKNGWKIIWEINSKCNLSCLHCCTMPSVINKEKEMTFDEIQNLFSKLSLLKIGKLVLTGGNPLLRRDFYKIASFVKSNISEVSLCTNGTLITKRNITKFVKLEFSNITIGFDGAKPTTHDWFRGVKGAFKRTTNAIRLLREHNCPVTIHVTLHRRNFFELPQIVNFAKKYGLKMNIGRILPIGKAKVSIQDIDLTASQNKILKKVVKQVIETAPSLISTIRIPLGNEYSLQKCPAGKHILGISASGKISPCLFLKDIDSSFEKEVKGDINTTIAMLRDKLENIKKNLLCSSCKAKCGGGCLASILSISNSNQEKESKYKVDPLCPIKE